jgi:hypothetical protein
LIQNKTKQKKRKKIYFKYNHGNCYKVFLLPEFKKQIFKTDDNTEDTMDVSKK